MAKMKDLKVRYLAAGPTHVSIQGCISPSRKKNAFLIGRRTKGTVGEPNPLRDPFYTISKVASP